jgi:hypothetical protein
LGTEVDKYMYKESNHGTTSSIGMSYDVEAVYNTSSPRNADAQCLLVKMNSYLNIAMFY